jgi:hypothetical protein
LWARGAPCFAVSRFAAASHSPAFEVVAGASPRWSLGQQGVKRGKRPHHPSPFSFILSPVSHTGRSSPFGSGKRLAREKRGAPHASPLRRSRASEGRSLGRPRGLRQPASLPRRGAASGAKPARGSSLTPAGPSPCRGSRAAKPASGPSPYTSPLRTAEPSSSRTSPALPLTRGSHLVKVGELRRGGKKKKAGLGPGLGSPPTGACAAR